MCCRAEAYECTYNFYEVTNSLNCGVLSLEPELARLSNAIQFPYKELMSDLTAHVSYQMD